MTAVVGIPCINDVVVAADRQVSAPDYFKYYESKIHVQRGTGWCVVYAYAGDPGLWKEARERIAREVEAAPSQDVSPDTVRAISGDVLTDIGQRHIEVNLDLFIATSSPNCLELLRFDGNSKALHVCDRLSFMGVGDSSLMRYWSDSMYSPEIDTDTGIVIGSYLIDKAKSYVDHCSGITDLIVVKKGGRAAFYDHPGGLATAMRTGEPAAFRKILSIGRKLLKDIPLVWP